MLNEGGVGGREREVLLEWSRGSDYRIVIHIESIELKRHSRMIMMIHWRVRLIQRILVKIRIVFGVIGYHYAVDRRYLRGEIGGSFPGLRFVSSYRK
jgi:hypothetical protein